MSKLQERIRNDDLIAAANSKYSSNLRSIASFNDYLLKEISYYKLSLLCKLRLSGSTNPKVFWSERKYLFDCNNFCQMCNLRKMDILEHFIREYPAHNGIRLQTIKNDKLLVEILNITSKNMIDNLFIYTINAIKIRSFGSWL